MNIANVCLRCLQSVASPHFQARGAGFVSLDALIKNDRKFEQGAGNSKSTGTESTHKADNGLLQPAPQQEHPASADKLLQTLFSSTPGELPKTFKTRYSRVDLDIPQKESEYFRAAHSPYPFEKQYFVLNRMLQKENPSLKDLWAQTKKILKLKPAESLKHTPRAQRVLLLMQRPLADILLLICRCRLSDLSTLGIPPAPEVVKLYLTHKVMLSNWDDILWIKLGALLETVHHFPKGSTYVEGFETHQATPLLEEILDIWEIFMEEYGTTDHSLRTQPPKSESLDQSENVGGSMPTSSDRTRAWHGLPKNLDTRLPSLNTRSAIRQRVLEFLPKYPNRPMNGIAEAALLTHDCIDILKKNSAISDSVVKSAQPFHSFVRYLNYKGHHLSGLVIEMLEANGLSSRIADLVVAGWEAAPKSKTEYLVSVGQTASEKNAFQQSTEWKMRQIRLISQDLARAVQRSDTGLASKLWQRFYDNSIHDGIMEISQDQILSQFLTAFFSLRRPEQAVNVWNAMVRWDLTPKQKHWQAMIVGSTKAKDITSVQQIWSNMKAAGFEPDTKSWTAWIHGLIKCGEWQIGLAALEELGSLWRRAPEKAETDDTGTSQLLPTIEPVNGAITALLATGKADLVPKVFRWAKSQNLTMNTSTFNIMLRPAIRKDRIDEVYDLLSEMQAHNCQPDIVTFTIILNGLLSNPTSSFHTQTPEAQQSTVLSLLSTLQNNGLTATAHTYSTVLDGLLSPQTLNLTAARAVLDHMAGNNLRPSPHIYTILISHYFDASPPNLAAIDSLLHRIRQEKGVLDPVFYDRMIEGYARMGEVEKMLQFVRRAPKEGKTPSWMALLAVLKELVRQQEWVFVKEFVADVSDQEEGLLRHGEGSKVGRDWFWELVDDLKESGVLREGQEGE